MTVSLSGRGSGHRTRSRSGLVALLGIALTGALTLPVSTASAAPLPKPDGTEQRSDVREIAPDAKYSTEKLGRLQQKRPGARAAAGVTPPVGTVRTLLGLDDYDGRYYRKAYTLRAVGDKIEVWVANDTAFPAGDCRNQVANTTTVTDAQALELADQFDDNMFPKESAAFSVAPDRDGSNALIEGDFSGSGDKIVTLVDNVRDDNFYFFPANPTYIAGFFSGQLNELLDRNVMTIDAFDWVHRTTANPPDESTSDLCTSRPAKPRLYEGTFAHEYQHLLQYYTDPDESTWVNEGLSDYAQTLVGYVDPGLTVRQKGADSHIFCWLGYGLVQTRSNPNTRDCGGPENSLTRWGDQEATVGPSSILADYGAAYSFITFLYDRYGIEFISTLHNDGEHQGLAGLQAALDQYAPGTDQYDVIHDFQVMTVIDREVGGPSGVVTGTDKARVTSPSLKSAIRFDNPRAYSRPGAAPNGADFLVLRDDKGRQLRGKRVESVSFQGAESLVPEELKWTVATDPPQHEGNPALWSGNDNNLDATAVTEVTVPTENATLTFEELHLAELGFDYAYTVISTDGGKTYTSLANDNTVPGPQGPALNGEAEGWATQTFDLSAYAGQDVVLGFRYVSDGGVNAGGWYVDDVQVGGQSINDGTATAPFESATQLRPVEVFAWNTRVVGYDAGGQKALVIEVPGGSWTLSDEQRAQLAAYPRVVAIVSYDEPTEQQQAQALYRLTVNGAAQPGGGLAAEEARSSVSS